MIIAGNQQQKTQAQYGKGIIEGESIDIWYLTRWLTHVEWVKPWEKEVIARLGSNLSIGKEFFSRNEYPRWLWDFYIVKPSNKLKLKS